ncbi:hypothetical protein D3C87_1730920 [compost metagenome]
MVADRVPAIDVALAAIEVGADLRLHFLDEDLVTHRLRRIDLRSAACKPGLQIAYSAENVGRRGGHCLADASLRSVYHARRIQKLDRHPRHPESFIPAGLRPRFCNNIVT